MIISPSTSAQSAGSRSARVLAVRFRTRTSGPKISRSRLSSGICLSSGYSTVTGISGSSRLSPHNFDRLVERGRANDRLEHGDPMNDFFRCDRIGALALYRGGKPFELGRERVEAAVLDDLG